jgi:hypothetical protein
MQQGQQQQNHSGQQQVHQAAVSIPQCPAPASMPSLSKLQDQFVDQSHSSANGKPTINWNIFLW